jgi:hypothetical protein
MADSLVASSGPAADIGGHSIAASRSVWILSGAAMTAMLLTPAIWNGFPIIFPDTGGYLTVALTGVPLPGRSALYGLFLTAGIPFAFWPCVLLQCALMVWLFAVTMRVNGLGGRPWLTLGIVAGLTVTTSLPWLAGQLMPDILFTASVLALYLLAFAHERLARFERYALAAVIALSIPTHMAAAGLCVALLAAFALIAAAARFWPMLWPAPRLSVAALAVAGGLALCPLSNLAVTGNFAFTPGGPGFLFGRLIEDGIVERYLGEHCPDPTISLCPYRDDMPDQADDWLWGNDSILYKLGGWDAHKAEQERIIRQTLFMYPGMHLEAAIVATATQLITFDTEVSFDDNDPTFDAVSQFIPALLPSLNAAHQHNGRFNVVALNDLHRPVGGLTMAALILALILRRRLKLTPEAAALCLVILLALAANAAICGVFSHPVDRYQSRLVLLAPFAVAILIAQRKRQPVNAQA